MSEVPDELLRRSAEAKAVALGLPVEEVLAEMRAETTEKVSSEEDGGGDSGGDGKVATSVRPTEPPVALPEGVRTQRLLTVVRAKAIQQVKAEPTDKVNVWPHLLLAEFTALMIITAFLLVLSVILQAPLLELADPNNTPNPAKAPWYFLGLQELLSYYDPQIAGVIIPGIIGLLGLMTVPYVDRNPSTRPSDRKFAILFFTFFLVGAGTLTMIGVLFRGPGFTFTIPWEDGIWFDDLKDWVEF